MRDGWRDWSRISNPEHSCLIPVRGITGIFYHPSFSRRSYLTAGRRLADFPAALGALLQHPQVRLVECPLATDEQILRVHDPALIPEVEADPF
jgi:hypothetical protein